MSCTLSTSISMSVFVSSPGAPRRHSRTARSANGTTVSVRPSKRMRPSTGLASATSWSMKSEQQFSICAFGLYTRVLVVAQSLHLYLARDRKPASSSAPHRGAAAENQPQCLQASLRCKMRSVNNSAAFGIVIRATERRGFGALSPFSQVPGSVRNELDAARHLRQPRTSSLLCYAVQGFRRANPPAVSYAILSSCALIDSCCRSSPV